MYEDNFKWIKVDWSFETSLNPSRPTEDYALLEIFKQSKAMRKFGTNLHFTDFEWKIFNLDRQIQEKVIPAQELEAKEQGHNISLRMVVHKISDNTGHTPEFIKKTLDNIEEKIYLREKLNLKPIPSRNEKLKSKKRAKIAAIIARKNI